MLPLVSNKIAPKPQPPNNTNILDWTRYYQDLACWNAMKADGRVEDGREGSTKRD
jgi:hypothetical protein